MVTNIKIENLMDSIAIFILLFRAVIWPYETSKYKFTYAKRVVLVI